MILEELNESDRDDLIAALDDHSIPGASIRNALRKRGYTIDDSIISRYRRGGLVTNLHESF